MKIVPTKGIAIVATFLMTISLAIGCATTKKIAEDITGRGKSLKKKIAFLPTLNETGYGGKELQESARIHLNTFFKRFCDDLIIIDSPKVRNLLEQIPRLASGKLDSLALDKLGKTLGLNAVLEQSLSDIECVSDRRGIWGFRKTCLVAQLSVRMRAYEIETGAILFDEVAQEAVEISEYDSQNIESRSGYDKEIAGRLLTKTTPGMYKRICKLLSHRQWNGYITSASENRFTLTAGKDVGLAMDDVLEVFGTSELIRGHAGQRYLIPGPKIGEVRITKIHRDRAEATAILGSDFQKSSHVRLKR